nr:MAG TPA: 60S ribosomal protein L2-A [Caudoviricetes sp.]
MKYLNILKAQKEKNDMLGILPGSDIGNTIIKALEELKQYRTIGTVEECRAAVEMQTAISRELIEGKYFCPKCHNLMPYPGYCGCGQKVY